MWKRYAMAVLTLGLWACAPAEVGEERAEDGATLRQEVMQTVGPLRQARYQHTSTRLPDGKVLYVGGGTGSSAPLLASAELYDPATGTTSFVASMNTARRSHTAVLLQDGSVLVLGGIAASVTSSVERYNPSTNTWTVMAPMPRDAYAHAATVLADGRVLVAGGSGDVASTYLFNPTTNTWAQTGSLALPRWKAVAVRLPDNRVLMIGGLTPRTEDRNTVELYDPSTGTWSTRARFLSSNGLPSAVLLPNGRVVVNGNGSVPSEYDVSTDTWRQLPAFTRGHSSGPLVLVEGAPVVVGGGYDERTLERFDSALQRWVSVGQLSIARNDITVDVVAGNAVLIAGGSQNNTYVPYATMDLFSGAGTCTPLTCAEVNAQCGPRADGCGGTLSCGTCGTNYTCNSSNMCIYTPPNDFSLSPGVLSRSIAKGGWATYSITTSGTGTLSLSASGMPPGSSSYFGTSTLQAGGSTFFQVQTMGDYVAAGRYTLTITGSDGTRTRSITVTLIITSAPGTDPLVNGGFETGTLSGWSSTGTVSVGPSAHSGGFTAVLGSPSSVLTGDSKLSQTFIVPAAGALLRYWFYGHAVDAPSDYASVLLTDNTTGVTTALLEHTYAAPPYQAWLDDYRDLTGYAGHSVTLTFVNHEAGWGGATYTFIDDVSLLVPGDFALSLAPDSQSARAGSAAIYTVNTTGQGVLNLSLSGLPSGATATFNPATVTAGQPSTLTVSTSTYTPVGSFSLSIKGTDTSTQVSRMAYAQLGVTAPPPAPGGSFSYSASNTNSAQQNTTHFSVTLTAGQTLRVGTCSVTGASGTGDTYLRLYGATGTQVTFNDDSCGTLSFMSYTASQSGTYQIRAGCYSSGSCGGTVAYTIQ